MPKSEAAAKADLTFIVGDPRSRQNLSRIRAHASRATRKGPDGSPESTISTAPTPQWIVSDETESGHHVDASDASQSQSQAPHLHPPQWNLNDETVSASSVEPEVVERAPDDVGGRASDRASSSSMSTSLGKSTAWGNPHYPTQQHFSTQGSTMGTWWELYPEAQGSAVGFHPFDPHKRSRLRHAEDEGEASIPKGSPSDDTTQEVTVGGHGPADHLAPLLSPVSQLDSTRPDSPDEKEHIRTRKFIPKAHRVSKSAQLKMQTRWRVVHGPSKALELPAEYANSQFELYLHHATNFYHVQYDTIWQPLLEQNTEALDVQSDFELFNESMISAAALVEAGQPKKAEAVVRCIVEMLVHLVHANHPQVYYIFLNMSLETSSTALGQLRRQMAEHMLPLCERMLGHDHPISTVLRIQLPVSARAPLHGTLMRRIQDCHRQMFGPDAYQTLAHQYVFARMLTDTDHVDEATEMFGSLTQSVERVMGMNSLLVVYILFDKATASLSATPPDTSIIPELHISDALRRLQIISQQNEKLPEDSNDAQKMEAAIVYSKIAGLRVLGKLHFARQNYGAAIQVYSQALQYGLATLGPDSVPVNLAEADLDAAKMEEVRMSIGGITVAGTATSPTPSTGPGHHVANTAVGSVKSMNRSRLERSSEAIPEHKSLVVGYTVVGMPSMGHAPVLNPTVPQQLMT